MITCKRCKAGMLEKKPRVPTQTLGKYPGSQAAAGAEEEPKLLVVGQFFWATGAARLSKALSGRSGGTRGWARIRRSWRGAGELLFLSVVNLASLRAQR